MAALIFLLALALLPGLSWAREVVCLGFLQCAASAFKAFLRKPSPPPTNGSKRRPDTSCRPAHAAEMVAERSRASSRTAVKKELRRTLRKMLHDQPPMSSWPSFHTADGREETDAVEGIYANVVQVPIFDLHFLSEGGAVRSPSRPPEREPQLTYEPPQSFLPLSPSSTESPRSVPLTRSREASSTPSRPQHTAAPSPPVWSQPSEIPSSRLSSPSSSPSSSTRRAGSFGGFSSSRFSSPLGSSGGAFRSKKWEPRGGSFSRFSPAGDSGSSPSPLPSPSRRDWRQESRERWRAERSMNRKRAWGGGGRIPQKSAFRVGSLEDELIEDNDVLQSWEKMDPQFREICRKRALPVSEGECKPPEDSGDGPFPLNVRVARELQHLATACARSTGPSSGFKYTAFSKAAAVIESAPVPVVNLSVALAVLREGGMKLSGEERQVVKKGRPRSSVLNAVAEVLQSGGSATLQKIKSSEKRALVRELLRSPFLIPEAAESVILRGGFGTFEEFQQNLQRGRGEGKGREGGQYRRQTAARGLEVPDPHSRFSSSSSESAALDSLSPLQREAGALGPSLVESLRGVEVEAWQGLFSELLRELPCLRTEKGEHGLLDDFSLSVHLRAETETEPGTRNEAPIPLGLHITIREKERAPTARENGGRACKAAPSVNLMTPTAATNTLSTGAPLPCVKRRRRTKRFKEMEAQMDTLLRRVKAEIVESLVKKGVAVSDLLGPSLLQEALESATKRREWLCVAHEEERREALSMEGSSEEVTGGKGKGEKGKKKGERKKAEGRGGKAGKKKSKDTETGENQRDLLFVKLPWNTQSFRAMELSCHLQL
uniref:Uncharacterized protein n=1 Tax=Chromera velia CCMP2878 TaxID=1169474 RepID=A0A0G4FMA2_9ALVE|eukprot:Cvel_17725.t1-p1 / transcript=Cvel_17725.t1 / gene=Cvel_17725 / organism=Chromera_velia_CCMP2878 / gene_product=hypothetical protein / transcript_product=hypothetical protein / location=Cvel_scaffold1431:40238-43891(-) / protein_length=830 / sequence_SO=supercontig / SO=protein_coding / is_pseudo=false